MNLVYKGPAVKEIRKLSPAVRKRIGTKLQFYAAQDELLNFALCLTQPADAQYRFRIGDYRVMFDIDGDDIIVLHVQHRREVYR